MDTVLLLTLMWFITGMTEWTECDAMQLYNPWNSTTFTFNFQIQPPPTKITTTVYHCMQCNVLIPFLSVLITQRKKDIIVVPKILLLSPIGIISRKSRDQQILEYSTVADICFARTHHLLTHHLCKSESVLKWLHEIMFYFQDSSETMQMKRQASLLLNLQYFRKATDEQKVLLQYLSNYASVKPPHLCDVSDILSSTALMDIVYDFMNILMCFTLRGKYNRLLHILNNTEFWPASNADLGQYINMTMTFYTQIKRGLVSVSSKLKLAAMMRNADIPRVEDFIFKTLPRAVLNFARLCQRFTCFKASIDITVILNGLRSLSGCQNRNVSIVTMCPGDMTIVDPRCTITRFRVTESSVDTSRVLSFDDFNITIVS